MNHGVLFGHPIGIGHLNPRHAECVCETRDMGERGVRSRGLSLLFRFMGIIY